MRPEDSIVRKYPFSAFRSGALDLPDLLYARGFDAVLIAGLATEVCCGSSARDAMIQNFRTGMLSDANAAMTPEQNRRRCWHSTRCSARDGDDVRIR